MCLIALEMGEVETLTPDQAALHGQGAGSDDVRKTGQNLMHTEPVPFNKQDMDTTVGRVILNDVLPDEMPFVNGLVEEEGSPRSWCSTCYLKVRGSHTTVKMLDDIKALGFMYATRAGISIGIDDMVVPEQKAQMVKGRPRRPVIEGPAASTNRGRYHAGANVITRSSKSGRAVTEEGGPTGMFKKMEEDGPVRAATWNPIYIMADSGAHEAADPAVVRYARSDGETVG